MRARIVSKDARRGGEDCVPEKAKQGRVDWWSTWLIKNDGGPWKYALAG